MPKNTGHKNYLGTFLICIKERILSFTIIKPRRYLHILVGDVIYTSTSILRDQRRINGSLLYETRKRIKYKWVLLLPYIGIMHVSFSSFEEIFSILYLDTTRRIIKFTVPHKRSLSRKIRD